MSLHKLGFAQLMRRIEDAFNLTLPTVALREGADEIVTSENGFPEADVSSLSIALYQMGLCKHLPDPGTHPAVPPIV
ncbi:MAG: hypothetical protein JWL77_6614 [Chthonomonadaceae bacterium]|nr:hypothetical protein [Chthonomonadaceae bacterium]